MYGNVHLGYMFEEFFKRYFQKKNENVNVIINDMKGLAHGVVWKS